jgi:hypothetical protein
MNLTARAAAWRFACTSLDVFDDLRAGREQEITVGDQSKRTITTQYEWAKGSS